MRKTFETPDLLSVAGIKSCVAGLAVALSSFLPVHVCLAETEPVPTETAEVSNAVEVERLGRAAFGSLWARSTTKELWVQTYKHSFEENSSHIEKYVVVPKTIPGLSESERLAVSLEKMSPVILNLDESLEASPGELSLLSVSLNKVGSESEIARILSKPAFKGSRLERVFAKLYYVHPKDAAQGFLLLRALRKLSNSGDFSVSVSGSSLLADFAFDSLKVIQIAKPRN